MPLPCPFHCVHFMIISFCNSKSFRKLPASSLVCTMCTSHAMPILCLVHCGNSATIASGSHREGGGQRALHSGGGGAPSSNWTSRKRWQRQRCEKVFAFRWGWSSVEHLGKGNNKAKATAREKATTRKRQQQGKSQQQGQRQEEGQRQQQRQRQ